MSAAAFATHRKRVLFAEETTEVTSREWRTDCRLQHSSVVSRRITFDRHLPEAAQSASRSNRDGRDCGAAGAPTDARRAVCDPFPAPPRDQSSEAGCFTLVILVKLFSDMSFRTASRIGRTILPRGPPEHKHKQASTSVEGLAMEAPSTTAGSRDDEGCAPEAGSVRTHMPSQERSRASAPPAGAASASAHYFFRRGFEQQS